MKSLSPVYTNEILNLDKLSVFYEDADPNSAIFGIKSLTNTLSLGRHAFFINPSEDFYITSDLVDSGQAQLRLKKSTPVKIEIIDFAGRRLYYEFPHISPEITHENGIRTLKKAELAYGYRGPDGEQGLAVSILVDNLVTDGTGKIVIVGELDNVPPQWKGVYNVRWQRPITIQKSAINKSTLQFYYAPTATISEFVAPYVSQSFSELTSSYSVSGSYIVQSVTPTPPSIQPTNKAE